MVGQQGASIDARDCSLPLTHAGAAMTTVMQDSRPLRHEAVVQVFHAAAGEKALGQGHDAGVEDGTGFRQHVEVRASWRRHEHGYAAYKAGWPHCVLRMQAGHGDALVCGTGS